MSLLKGFIYTDNLELRADFAKQEFGIICLETD